MSRLVLASFLVTVACSTESIDQTVGSGDALDAPVAETPQAGDDANSRDDQLAPQELEQDDEPVLALNQLTGSFGAVTGFADELYELEASVGPANTTVTLHVLGDYGWAMLRLNLYGQLGQYPLRAGETVYLSGFSIEPDDQDADGPVVGGSVQGCSGPDYWQWDDDTWTEDVSIGLSNDPITGGMILEIDAEFGNGDHMVGTALIQ